MEYQWVDHHAPPLKLLFVICNEIHNFLKGNLSKLYQKMAIMLLPLTAELEKVELVRLYVVISFSQEDLIMLRIVLITIQRRDSIPAME
jgi:hypothetical protein